jgi:RHS repeat-associated protein
MRKIFILMFSLLTVSTFAQKIIDDGEDPVNYYRDLDGDGYGNPAVTTLSNNPMPGWVLNNLDCNDNNASITVASLWYQDSDGDGFGDPSSFISSCSQPSGYVNNNNDNCPSQAGTNNGCPISLTVHNFGSYNYVYEEILKIATTEANYNSVTDANKIRSISYFDGLGRKVQSRGIGHSPLGKDIVQHIEYDAFGRASKGYLPYVSSQNNGFYETGGQTKTISHYNVAKYGNTTNPYSEKIFDGSPLNKILETGAPGSTWIANPTSDSDRTVKIGYAVNNSTDYVRIYNVTLDSNYNPTLSNPSPTYYTSGALYKIIVKNENWTPSSGKEHTTEEFQNKFGQTLLKRTYVKNGSTDIAHDTYYVYDIYNNLTYVIPPKVITSDGVSTTELNELIFQYKYDKYNRLVEKKIPGKGREYIVYDNSDRPILMQDAVQRAKSTKEWVFTKYDAFGRITYTGIYKNNNSRTSVQSSADAHTTKYEARGSALYHYTNNAFPTGISYTDVYTVNYYDDYGYWKHGLSVPSTVYGVTTTTNTKSLPTGVKERVLGTTNDWVVTITGYDDKAREVYIATKNEFTNTTDVSQSSLDFIGKVIQTTSTHTANTTMSIVNSFTYDHIGRVLTQKQKINTQAEELIVKNAYDELGVLENKKVGNTEANPLQTVDYKYNVRGWLTDINDVDNIGTDLFTFKINYDSKDISGATGYSSLYNGNIAETIWRTKSDYKKRGYQYKYDGLSRITGAHYREENNLLSGSGKYETYYDYDKNGNLNNLFRNGSTNSSIDELSYSYATSSNKLTEVLDEAFNSEGFESNSVVYSYDANNGNLITDSGKGITNIEYNYLNLPTKVEFGSTKRIEYIYTATGVKLQKKVTNGSITTTNYAGAFIYENGTLKYFSQPEGYVEVSGSSFTYIYQYTDHLGNVRINYTNTGSSSLPVLQIREENNYYPFGMKMAGINTAIVGVQNDLKYNGKEYQDEVINSKKLQWYDYGARNYDVTIGRWMNIDPLAASLSQIDKSPYAYTWNNPINLIDPDGMEPSSIGAGSTTYDCATGDCSMGVDRQGNFSVSGKVASNNSGDTHIAIYEDGTTSVISEKDYKYWVKSGVNEVACCDFIYFLIGNANLKTNSREREFFRNNPGTAKIIKTAAGKAGYKAARYGESFGGGEDGYGDALRHAYWMYLIAKELGVKNAIYYGDLHELRETRNRFGEKTLVNSNGPKQIMDKHNNRWGANFASKNLKLSPGNDFEHYFDDAVRRGEIIIIRKSTIPSESLRVKYNRIKKMNGTDRIIRFGEN